MAGQDNDPYFGFDPRTLDVPSNPASIFSPAIGKQPSYQGPPALPRYYSDTWKNGNDTGASHGSYDFGGLDIEVINKQIMGEQPGTTEERSQQWNNVAVMLQGVADQLREQTQALAAHWESPGAKKVFLEKVGMTLAYLTAWQQAAIVNSVALYGVAGVMREAQAEMEQLYYEYSMEVGVLKSMNQDPRMIDPYLGRKFIPDRTVREEVAAYDKRARELANRIASEYAPYLTQLENGRAKMVETLNAVVHPGAYGPMPPPGNYYLGNGGGTVPTGFGGAPPGGNHGKPPGKDYGKPPGKDYGKPPGSNGTPPPAPGPAPQGVPT
ncbi:hypothetical protein FNH05_06435, partial [Amycolatopsis rhizosphaerae]